MCGESGLELLCASRVGFDLKFENHPLSRMTKELRATYPCRKCDEMRDHLVDKMDGHWDLRPLVFYVSWSWFLKNWPKKLIQCPKCTSNGYKFKEEETEPPAVITPTEMAEAISQQTNSLLFGIAKPILLEIASLLPLRSRSRLWDSLVTPFEVS